MACKISQDKAVKLDLPGRVSRQIVSGGSGANNISVRLVEIEMMTKGQSRKRHYHPDAFMFSRVPVGQKQIRETIIYDLGTR